MGYARLQRFHSLANGFAKQLFHDGEIGAVGNVACSSHYLQLRGAFVDGEDAGIAIEALCLVLHDEARPAMHRDGIVGILVHIF